MFKAPKKRRKQPALVARTTGPDHDDDDDDVGATAGPSRAQHNKHEEDEESTGEEGGGLLAAQRKIKARKDRKKKKIRLGVGVGAGVGSMSFDPEENGDNDEDAGGNKHRKKREKKEKKRRKKDKQKKSGGGGGMGFGGGVLFHDDDDGDEQPAAAAQGYTYGTMRSSSDTANVASATDTTATHKKVEDDGQKEEGSGGGSMYGAAALEALRSKQKVYIAPRTEKEKEVVVANDNDRGATSTRPDQMQQQEGTIGTATFANFIPLNGGSNIVAGDDALAYMEEEDGERDGMADPSSSARRKDRRTGVGTDRLSNLTATTQGGDKQRGILGGEAKDSDIDDGGRKWEEEVARRAGLGGKQQQQEQIGGATATSSSGAPAVASLDTMRTTISKTLTHLSQRRDDLESTRDRRQNELTGLQNELRLQEDDLKMGGKSFEYYQDLRLDIADWVGALRNLSTKVETICDAIREQEVEAAERRRLKGRQREDDAAAILRSKNFLHSIVGRAIPSEDDDSGATPCVDEFGRDVKSAEVLARERRTIRRRRVRRESRDRRKQQTEQLQNKDGELSDLTAVAGDDTEADMSDNEIEEQTQRTSALEAAVLLANDEMDDKYSSLKGLQDLFLSWAKHSPEDYKRCYAKLSLADMAIVLVKAETCTKINMLRNSTSSNIDMADFEWVRTASSFENEQPNASKDEGEEKSAKNEEQTDDENLLCIISRKALLPYLLSLMGMEEGNKSEPLYDPLSSRQTKLVLSLYKFLKSTLGDTGGGVIQDMSKIIVGVVRASLETMSVLILQPDALRLLGNEDGDNGEGGDVREAVIFAAVEQVCRIQKWIKNVVVLSSEVVHIASRRELATLILMDAVASRLLPILALWKRTDKLGEQKAQTVLKDVWNDINNAGWLDDENLMLQAAPLRAAAQSFGIR